LPLHPCQRRAGSGSSAQARIDGRTFRLVKGEVALELGAEHALGLLARDGPRVACVEVEPAAVGTFRAR
jgi:hypothetical protein